MYLLKSLYINKKYVVIDDCLADCILFYVTNYSFANNNLIL